MVHREAPGDVRGRPHVLLGLYFGTTGGEVWASRERGRTGSCIARHLPEIYAIDARARECAAGLHRQDREPAALVHATAPRRSRPTGATLADVLADLDRRFPGMRFRMIDEQERIRPHIRLFVNTDEATRLSADVRGGDTVHLICALSGG